MTKNQIPNRKRVSMVQMPKIQTKDRGHPVEFEHFFIGNLNPFEIWPLRFGISILLCAFALTTAADPKPIPRLQILPQPDDQAAFVRDDTEIARYHFAPTLRRPYIFPLIGPAGRSL